MELLEAPSKLEVVMSRGKKEDCERGEE